ncbi:MAG TPA: hypothetical protein PLN52_17500 [Opitutaceae bacterium]|nr:hypothetical protein [Opitutaceae bacterium]
MKNQHTPLTFFLLGILVIVVPRLAAGKSLQNVPITLYPEVNLYDSGYPAFVNSHARSGDAVVLSSTDAFKGESRTSRLGIVRGEVWLHVPTDMNFDQANERHLEDVSGVVFIPFDEAKPLRLHGGLPAFNSSRALSIEARRVTRSAQAKKYKLIVGLEPKAARSLGNVADITREAEVLTIYDPKKLRQGAVAYREYAQRLIRAARDVNPGIQVELAISTGADERATQNLVNVLQSTADLFDRIGIYCDETPESRASVALIYHLLRGDA